LRADIDITETTVVKNIERRARKVQSSAEIAHVGTLSTNGDKAIGKMIADATGKVGNEGGDQGRGGQDRRDRALDVVEGRGCSPTGATSRPISSPAPKRWWPRLEDAHILIHEKKLSSLQLLPILEAAVQTAKPLLLVAEDIERRRHRSGGGAALLRAEAAVGKLKDQS
jgi:chaperonin GroEL